VDEVALKNRFGERVLRKRFYDSAKHHPAVLAEKLAPVYVTLILANQLLRTKKVVVIDLDETVWRGVIGEGQVEHFQDRQAILRDLRHKGILLAVASKNDPRNVHWKGGVLESADFVAEQINWNPKPASIRRIAEDLNLKLKDFVFIDDRADEREMVKSSVPEIEVLDATADASWEMLRAWVDSLAKPTEGDRTQQYRERRQRESYLDAAREGFNENVMFSSLDLKVEFHLATAKELERVAELINRTNQFNTTARRTSLRQVKQWAASADWRILVAQARDKFGTMGIISAMVVQVTSESAQVSAWVLSCRVFGFGIEMAMLNALRRVAARLRRHKLEGRIVETPHNQPCRDVFARNGFQLREGVWHSDSEIEMLDPEWLQIVYGEGLDAIRNVEPA
jgi:FkbH-like protein